MYAWRSTPSRVDVDVVGGLLAFELAGLSTGGSAHRLLVFVLVPIEAVILGKPHSCKKGRMDFQSVLEIRKMDFQSVLEIRKMDFQSVLEIQR